MVTRAVDEIAAFAVRNARHVLVAALALSVVISLGFARTDVDTDPTLLGSSEGESAEGEQPLVLSIRSDRTLLVGEILRDLVVLESRIARLDGVEDVIAIGDALDGAVPETRQEINAAYAAIEADTALSGVILSADRSTSTMLIELDGSSAATDVAAAIRAEIAESAGLAAFDTSVASFAIAEERVADHLYGQALARTVAGIVLAAVVAVAVFRRLALAGVVVASIVVSWLSAGGLVTLFGASFGVTSTLVPAAVLVVSIVHLVRLTSAYHTDPAVFVDEEGAVASLVASGTMAAARSFLVVGVGLVVLGVVEAQYRTLAWSTATALLVALIVGITALPAALVTIGRERLAARSDVDDDVVATGSRWTALAGVRYRDVVLSVVAIVIGIGAVGIGTAALDDNPFRWIRGSSVEAIDIEAAETGGIGVTSAVLQLDAELTNQLVSSTTLGALGALESAWDRDPQIGPSMSYSGLVAADSSVATRDAFERLEVTHLVGDELVGPGSTSASIRVWLRSGDGDAVRDLIEVTSRQLESEPLNPGVTVSWQGPAVDAIEWQDDVVRAPVWGMALAVLAAVLVAGVVMRSARWALIAAAPAAVAFVAVFGFLGWKDGAHGVPSAIAGVVFIAFALEAGVMATEHQRRLRGRTWSAVEATANFGVGPARGMLVAGLMVVAAMLPLARADLLPNGRGGSLLMLAAGFGAYWAVVCVAALTSGPPRNTAPLTVRGASPA